MPLAIEEANSQVTGSTFDGGPSVVGGIYYGSGNVGSLPAYVQSLRVDPSGSVFVTASGSLPVHIDAPIQATIGGEVSVANFPAVQAVSGNVGTYTSGLQGVSGTVQVWSEGPIAMSGSMNVFTSGLQGVSGTVQI